MTDVLTRLARMETLAQTLMLEIAALHSEIAGAPEAASMRPVLSTGTAIKVARVRQGIKRPALAVLAGISYPYLAEIETDRKDAPVRTLRKIADALGVPLTELIGE